MRNVDLCRLAGGFLHVRLLEVGDAFGVAVREFGLAQLDPRVGDDSARVGIVGVELGQFVRGGHDVLPPSGLVQCSHFVDECAESLRLNARAPAAPQRPDRSDRPHKSVPAR